MQMELPVDRQRLPATMTVRSAVLLIAVLSLAVTGCAGRSSAPSSSPTAPSLSPVGTTSADTGIAGRATAGPVCPVEQVPPDPACAARPVAGAVLVIRDRSGAEVQRIKTAADGSFAAKVAPSAYVVEPQPVEGLMGTPGAQDVLVNAGPATTIEIVYDTGIRGPAALPS